MKQNILITDVTAMRGDRVCIAGINQKSENVRPDLGPPGIFMRNLYDKDEQLVIRPRAVVQLQLSPKPRCAPPHLEDNIWYEPQTAHSIVLLGNDEWLSRLEATAVLTPEDAFGARLYDNKYVKPEEASSSLTTLHCANLEEFRYGIDPYKDDEYDYRLSFSDGAGNSFSDIPIRDLSLRRYADYLREHQRMSFLQVGRSIQEALEDTITIWLRLGLGRPWPSPTAMPRELRCYLQVNGIYTSPDYLEGRCFADFT